MNCNRGLRGLTGQQGFTIYVNDLPLNANKSNTIGEPAALSSLASEITYFYYNVLVPIDKASIPTEVDGNLFIPQSVAELLPDGQIIILKDSQGIFAPDNDYIRLIITVGGNQTITNGIDFTSTEAILSRANPDDIPFVSLQKITIGTAIKWIAIVWGGVFAASL